MSDSSDTTYTARLIGSDGSEETVELDLIAGEPQKSFIRPAGEDSEEMVWQHDPDAEGHVYRQGGIPSADYS
ncbi:hypothetical protein [Planctomonas psychrotolerans]|uniref:hypothetical protein n=1 Tax=Planctomonas psychrotolerans TaxID=2528712 RepID=UPI00123A007B|nr:hypothetical protein [Planctomonas psychrotolerans]